MKYQIAIFVVLGSAISAPSSDGQAMPQSISCAVMTDRIVDVASATRGQMFSDYKGRRYFFCCGACPDEFKKHPDQYAQFSSIPTPSSASGARAPTAMQEATIAGAYWLGDDASELPTWVNRSIPGIDLVIVLKGSVDISPVRLREFYRNSSHDFLLKAPGKADVKVSVQDHNFCDDAGKYQGFYASIDPADRAKLAFDVDYRLEPVSSEGHSALWKSLKPIVVHPAHKAPLLTDH